MSLNCPLLKPSCKRSIMFGEKTPFEKPKCPLSDLIPKCPKPEPCPLSSLSEPPPCPLSKPKCPLAQAKDVSCPFSFPSPCPSNPTCPLASPPCPLSPPKCPLAPPPCPLNPPKCPLAPIDCPLKPQPCPLTVPQRPQCALIPPKCPLESIISPVKSNLPLDICPLDNPPDIISPCPHIQYLNKGLTNRPLSNPIPPPLCKEIARKCPFEPKPMICHEMCPCSEVPEVISGPQCPFLPPDPPACPPICPLERQPDCPLVQKPRCMWKPTTPTQCPFSPPTRECPPPSPCCCLLKCADLCPSFVKIPGKGRKVEKAKAKNLNIECCPFCDKKPKIKVEVCKPERSFHFPSCPLFKPPCQLESLPKDVSSCPFYPCPCPLTGTDCCPIKVPPLRVAERKCNYRKSDISIENAVNQPSLEKSPSQCISEQPECPLSNIPCPVPAPSCPLANFKCPLANFKCPSPSQPSFPCPVKGCLKNASSRSNGDCVKKTDSCAMFPEGRQPDEDLGLCDCDYPVAPCMVDMNKTSSHIAPPQFCMKDDCCMGLPDPPINVVSSSNSAYYSYVALHPESESTKYYVDISDEPPDDTASMMFGPPKEGLNRSYSVIKFGEGYKQCKTVKEILEKRGPRRDSGSQYDLKDCPMDEMAKRIKMSNNKKKAK